MSLRRLVIASICSVSIAAHAQSSQPDWSKIEEETMRHYQALVRFDTTEKERPAAEYIKRVLDENGIAAQMFSTEPDRPNVVARLKGSGKERPLLVMGHTDTGRLDAA